MIGFLRFTGLLNAAIWLGATVFCSTAVRAALNSHDLVNLVGAKYFTPVSGAVAYIIQARLFQLQIACALLAWLHLLGEWLYLGRQPGRGRVALLTGLFTLSLMGSFWLGPQLTRLHHAQHAPGVRVEDRDAAARSFPRWHGMLQTTNVLMIGGVIFYFWRITQTDNALRFVHPVNFRS